MNEEPKAEEPKPEAEPEQAKPDEEVANAEEAKPDGMPTMWEALRKDFAPLAEELEKALALPDEDFRFALKQINEHLADYMPAKDSALEGVLLDAIEKGAEEVEKGKAQ